MPKTLEEARKEFLKNNYELIARAPACYFWSGEYADMYGQLAIVHPIPLYSYVGIEQGNYNDFKLEFEDIRIESSIDFDRASGDEMELVRRPQVAERMKKYLEFWKEQNNQEYFRIRLWSEIPSRCGLDASGAAMASLAAIMQIIETAEDKREKLITTINSWANKPIKELKEDGIFRAVFRKAWILDDCAHNFLSSGTGPFSSLVGSPNGNLVLYFTEKKGFDTTYPVQRLSKTLEELKPDYFQQFEEKIKAIDWWSTRFALKQDLKEWLRIAIVYSGIPEDTGKILAKLEKRYKTPIEELRASFLKSFPEFRETAKLTRPISDFLKKHKKPLREAELYPKYLFSESLGLLSCILLNILERGNTDELFSHVMTINKCLDFFGVFPQELTESYSKVKGDFNIGLKLAGYGGGDFVVFGEADTMRSVEERCIGNKNYVHFSTYRMGWEAEGLTIIKPSEKKTSFAPPEQDTLKIRFNAKEKNPRIILINGQFPPKPVSERIFVHVLLLAAGRKKDRLVKRTTELLFPPTTSLGGQILDDIKKFFEDSSFDLKGRVDKRDIVPSVRGEVSFGLFHKKFIKIDLSVRRFESWHMAGLEEMVKNKLLALDSLENNSIHGDNFSAIDSLEFGDGKSSGRKIAAEYMGSNFENKVRFTFRHTRIVMRALEIMNWKFQDEAWWERWTRLQRNCRQLLRQMGWKNQEIEQQFFLPPQRGHQ